MASYFGGKAYGNEGEVQKALKQCKGDDVWEVADQACQILRHKFGYSTPCYPKAGGLLFFKNNDYELKKIGGVWKCREK